MKKPIPRLPKPCGRCTTCLSRRLVYMKPTIETCLLTSHLLGGTHATRRSFQGAGELGQIHSP